jgi:hypothetical protein
MCRLSILGHQHLYGSIKPLCLDIRTHWAGDHFKSRNFSSLLPRLTFNAIVEEYQLEGRKVHLGAYEALLLLTKRPVHEMLQRYIKVDHMETHLNMRS